MPKDFLSYTVFKNCMCPIIIINAIIQFNWNSECIGIHSSISQDMFI